MHRDLQARGVKLVLFPSPLPEVTLEALRRRSLKLDLELDFLRVFERFVGDLRRNGVCVLDPISDSAFPEDLGLFADFSHLNRRGAAVFSSRLGDLFRAGAGDCLSGPPI